MFTSNCPDENELALYLEHAISGVSKWVIEQHLASCSTCRQTVLDARELEMLYNDEHDTIPESERIAFRHAAKSTKNHCVINAEHYLLSQSGITVDINELCLMAGDAQWLDQKGVEFRNVGKILEHYGLSVRRKLHNTIDELKTELDHGNSVIVGVDIGELFHRSLLVDLAEKIEDIFDRKPDHVVIVESVNRKLGESSYDNVAVLNFDQHEVSEYLIPIDRFLDAWDDSDNLMIVLDKNQTT